MRDRRGAVEHERQHEREHRIQALARQSRAARTGTSSRAPRSPNAAPTAISTGNSRATTVTPALVGGKLDHAEHECDPGGVVHARLALERRARPSGDLAPPEHREHHGRVGRRERRADETGERPAHPEQHVRDDRDRGGGQKRAGEPKREHRRKRAPQPPHTNVDPTVEQDHDERDDRDPLHGADRDVLVEARPRSDTTAAATRNIAGAGTGIRSVSLVERRATVKPPATTRTRMAKSAISGMATQRRPGFPARHTRRYQPAVSAGELYVPMALSRVSVLEAALGIADDDGVQALSIRRLAATWVHPRERSLPAPALAAAVRRGIVAIQCRPGCPPICSTSSRRCNRHSRRPRSCRRTATRMPGSRRRRAGGSWGARRSTEPRSTPRACSAGASWARRRTADPAGRVAVCHPADGCRDAGPATGISDV